MLTEAQRKSIVLTYRLTPATAKVFELLLEVPMATNKMIEDAIVGSATPAKIIVWRLREQLHGTTVTIHKRNRVGYWIDPATKQHIKRMLDENVKYILPPAGERSEITNTAA